ncbi:hypothetical protein ROJ8625_03512 [Roseivivax jejudonensis]|uniref:Phasin domain-containing protein n=1 Tax=Roseivivax jejudonensis TaxID=1529041 RepID=A0A1X7A404_9RHOB|nr:hypothetical protein [Roseivivax jejudonensis]SLN68041.1 hypothetical protein ROJ8625_03512 [Roseivivax jejudonensis]
MNDQTQNFDAMIRNAMDAFPVKGEAFETGFKRGADLNEKLTTIAVDAAGRSTELSAEWTRDTLSRVAEMSKAKSEPAAYAQSFADLTTKQMEGTVERMTAFAEIVKAAQMATVEALMDAGKAQSETAAKTATNTARKTAAAAK